MKRTISILVENHSGVLARVSGLFARRGFNIESLAVGVTEDETMSRITIVADGDSRTIEQVEKQLNKLIDVIKVRTQESEEIISRELMLVKVSALPAQRGEITNIVDIMGGKISDITRTTMTVEISNESGKLETTIELLRPYGIKEVIRTGTIAILRGKDSLR